MFKKMFATIFQPSLEVAAPDEDFYEKEVKRLQEDLEIKRKAAIERLGSKWILHPDHHVKNMNVSANALGFKTA